MDNLARFTNPASGSNIKTLLKELNDKGAQLRSVLWLEEKAKPQPEQGCTCADDDDEPECDWCAFEPDDEPEHIAPCQLELSVGTNVVLTEIFADQVEQILPFIKQWVIKDLEAIEQKLNSQGVYLQGQRPNAPVLPKAPFDPVNIQFLSKHPEKGDLVVMLEDVVVTHPHPRASSLTLKKGTKHRVIMTETALADSSVLVHIQPEAGLEIYRVNTLSIQPIQE